MSLSTTTITNSIAALSITGVTIKDIDEIPEAVTDRQCPILYPEPLNFIRNLVVNPMTFGTAGSGYFDVDYDMAYTLLYRPVGASRMLLNLYPPMLELAMDVVDKIIVSDAVTGTVDLTFAGFEGFGVALDPSGNSFIGTGMVFHVKEFE
jgi:hypothetical protein